MGTSMGASRGIQLKTAQIYRPMSGKIIGGLVVARHEGEDVTISFGGIHKRGRALTLADILKIEAATGSATLG